MYSRPILQAFYWCPVCRMQVLSNLCYHSNGKTNILLMTATLINCAHVQNNIVLDYNKNMIVEKVSHHLSGKIMD